MYLKEIEHKQQIWKKLVSSACPTGGLRLLTWSSQSQQEPNRKPKGIQKMTTTKQEEKALLMLY